MAEGAPDDALKWREWANRQRVARPFAAWQPQPLVAPVNNSVARRTLAREVQVLSLGGSSGGEYHEVPSMLQTAFSGICTPYQSAPRTMTSLSSTLPGRTRAAASWSRTSVVSFSRHWCPMASAAYGCTAPSWLALWGARKIWASAFLTVSAGYFMTRATPRSCTGRRPGGKCGKSTSPCLSPEIVTETGRAWSRYRLKPVM